MIDGTTRVFAILGNPVAHSLSPTMYNAAFRVLGLPAVYVPFPCPADEVPTLIRAIGKAGGGGNVTVPHKEIAARAVDVRQDLVDEVDACNTFWSDNGCTVGDNTDVAGVLEALRELEAPSTPWLIAGTGGAARAAVMAAKSQGVRVAVTSREASRLRRFEEWIDSRAGRSRRDLRLWGSDQCHATWLE